MSLPDPACWLDAYRAPLREALHAAAADGYRLLEANAAHGELRPQDFPRSARRELARLLANLGTGLVAVALDYPGAGLADPAAADARADAVGRTLALCRDLGVPRAAVKLAGFADPRHAELAGEMLAVAAGLADRHNIRLAIHTGPDDPARAAERLRALNCPHVSLALDTAHLLPVADEARRALDVAGAVYLRDVRRVGGRVEEVPFGEGEVDLPQLLTRLEQADYRGWLSVRRDARELAPGEMRRGREYVADLIRVLRARG
jgi:sugar phosphate isomerase/epimerase